MPYEIQFEHLPLGHALTGSREDNQQVSVQCIEFTSTEDGQHFIQRLEGFPSDIVEAIRPQKSFSPSTIDHLLAVIRRNKSATVYVNELSQVLTIRPARSILKGEQVLKEDIVDVSGFSLKGVDVPDDAGVVFLFSVGWRKGLFYDLSPLNPNERITRKIDLSATLGAFYAHVAFQERFAISDEEWKALFDQQWFPFAGLGHEVTNRMLNNIRSNWPIDQLLDTILLELGLRLDAFVEAWSTHPALKCHLPLLQHAVERFKEKDFISVA